MSVSGSAGHHKEGLRAEPVADVANASRGAEQALLLAVGEVDPERCAVAEMAANRLREPVQVRDHLTHVVARDQAQHVLHDGPVRNRHHGLGHLVGERPQACAQPCRHDHGLHRR